MKLEQVKSLDEFEPRYSMSAETSNPKLFEAILKNQKSKGDKICLDLLTFVLKVDKPGDVKVGVETGDAKRHSIDLAQMTVRYPTTYFPYDGGVICEVWGVEGAITIPVAEGIGDDWAEMRAFMEENNRACSVEPSPAILAELERIAQAPTPLRHKETRALPVSLAQPTFIEARQATYALSDGRDRRDWKQIDGVIALLHSAPRAEISTRFEPSALMLEWWGTAGAQIDALWNELARLDLDDIILFRVVLSAILHAEKARFSASLDDIITLIGRDTDARRSAAEREKWRAKVWRSIVLFDSMAIYGARALGQWREPGAKGSKRAKMDAEALYSRDPLLRIVGTRDTEQGTFDGSAPPKEVSLVPGDWLMPFHGNREVLSEFGDILPIAQIPRGKPAGAWAACAGLMLTQLWREQATKAELFRVSRGGDEKVEVLKFRPFTRRELLAGTLRADYDVSKILSDPKNGGRARGYWKSAIAELKTRGVIGHYAEPKSGASWRAVWLDEPLDIRPAGEMLADALRIHKDAQAAKKRGNRKRALSKAPDTKGDG